jgi:anaerobic ribonucleoside-triphosphate reductase activating protein
MSSAESELRVHSFLPETKANGPGLRCALWLQGCSLGCPGCFNPETHAFDAGTLVSANEIFEQIQQVSQQVEGLTISGGEPLFQIKPLTCLLKLVRQHTNLSTLIFTGFSIEETQKMPAFEELTSYLDVLIAGRYREDLRLARNLIASSNKSVQFYTDRYCDQDFQDIPQAEIFINSDGEIIATGINPLLLKQGAK